MLTFQDHYLKLGPLVDYSSRTQYIYVCNLLSMDFFFKKQIWCCICRNLQEEAFSKAKKINLLNCYYIRVKYLLSSPGLLFRNLV